MELLKGDFCLREVLMNSGRGQREPVLQQTTWRRYSFLWWIRIIRQRGQSYENIYNRTSERKKNGSDTCYAGGGSLGGIVCVCKFYRQERYFAEPADSSYGCPADPALRYDNGSEYVWDRSCRLHGL